MALQIEPTAAIEIHRHSVTLDEYDRMVMFGVFAPGVNIELVKGEIVDMPPVGPEHEATVSDLTLFLSEQLRRNGILWPQGNSIGIPQSNSRPQPDLTILRWRDDRYHEKRPEPEDVIVVIEVSDSTLRFDRKEKLQLYAEAGIPEYWIVNLVERVIEVYAGPDRSKGEYSVVKKLRRGDVLSIPSGIGGDIVVGDIVGQGTGRRK